MESVHPDWWTRKEKEGVAKLIGLSGIKKSKSKIHAKQTRNSTAIGRQGSARYPANKQTKEEVACVGNRSLGQSLQLVGVHYLAERYLQGCLEGRERLQAAELHGCTCCY
ncbi:hypothetical protein TNCV_1604991 [Trichonephila clavipes]|nr:hypothetical protein TNCV_1604991 [Trichonephila clavipes]